MKENNDTTLTQIEFMIEKMMKEAEELKQLKEDNKDADNFRALLVNMNYD